MPSKEYKDTLKKLDERRTNMADKPKVLRCVDCGRFTNGLPCDHCKSSTGVSKEGFIHIDVESLTAPANDLYGHPDFYKIVDELKDLHSRKNHDYAAGGDPLGNFYRVANILSQYPGLDVSDPTVVAIIYALKQLDAVLWILANDIETMVEGAGDRFRDISVYSILAMILNKEATMDERR